MCTASVNTVLFDWDGTLCDSGAAVMRAFEKSLADFEVRFTREQYNAFYTPAWTVMFEAFGLPRPLWTQAEERWVFHYHDEQPQLLPGAASVVETLRRAGLRLGIVTGATRHRLYSELSRLGFDGAFASVICHEDVVHKKPHPEGIHSSLERLHTEPQNCCFVGDAPDDIRMGRSAGVCTAAVRSEYVHPARLDECGADHVLQTIGELPAILPLMRICSR